MYPHPGGHIIAALTVGDEVTIKTGAGDPTTESDVVEVVIDVDRASALTNSGRVLLCKDGLLVEPTGVHYDDESQYPSPVSEKARQLLEVANKAKAERDAEEAAFLEAVEAELDDGGNSENLSQDLL